MKIYTKTGDEGKTSLLGGIRIFKSCLEMEAIGEVDELNSRIGILVSVFKPCDLDDAKNQLTQIQHHLFTIGSNLASIQTKLDNVPRLEDRHIEDLERWIDNMSDDIPPLDQFILPGGHIAAAQSYFARTVCRRAERKVIKLSRGQKLDDNIKQYLNRLSDYFFTLARYINFKHGEEEIKWKKEI